MKEASESHDDRSVDLVGLEEDPKWGAVLDELDDELGTRITAHEFDDEWTRPDRADD